ncbi:MAG: nucleotidyltransferase family protein [Oscillospiraceae bacterium]|jgi:D-glycero-alpha-D-manno-heptose 1-phosphate guanylyltransferase|nr:nucleotidyltransferase family protein [Oscillospiraceae bacterium]
MQAIVLAGGYGTRLRSVLKNMPKPMALVAGKPFLEYILTWLLANGITETIIAVGYMGESIVSHFKDRYHGMKIRYSRETEPLKTGGAIKKALGYCPENTVFIINGDTYFDVDLRSMEVDFNEKKYDLLMAVKELHNFDRYGSLIIEDGRVTAFSEKQRQIYGYINGGVYIVNRDLLDDCPEIFSFETDFMEKSISNICIGAFVSTGYFIDIGIPEDYELAQVEFRGGAPR